MGRKIFVSYKYSDVKVKNLIYGADSTVRDYVTKFEKIVDASDDIFKGESDDEDISMLDEDTIWGKLRDRIFDSTITVIFVSPGMRETNKSDRDQWIPWEISYSLKESSRKNKNGDAVTSKTNALLAVILPDQSGSYKYYFENKECCESGCTKYYRNNLFDIMKDNMFNLKTPTKKVCKNGDNIWSGEPSYIVSVRWDEFYSDYTKHINRALEIQGKADDYELRKEK